MLVLEVISGLCREPLALVEMFVNYDCDLEAIDLFKRIVTALVKVGLRGGGWEHKWKDMYEASYFLRTTRVHAGTRMTSSADLLFRTGRRGLKHEIVTPPPLPPLK